MTKTDHRIGETNGNARLTEAEVKAIKLMMINSVPRETIMKAFKMSSYMYWHIKSGRTWSHVIL